MSQVFRIVYTQTLIGDATGTLTEARPDVHFQIGYAAIETGWLRRFQRRWSDLGLLIGLGLHARPLVGDDLDLLCDLNLVGPRDKGRLYARVTDLGLAAVTSIERVTGIPQCASRLAADGLLRVLDLPDKFRDSRGQFSGRHAYLLLGSVVSQADNREGLSLTATQHRAGLPLTVHEGLSLTKLIPSSSTLSNESGAVPAPAADATPATPSHVPAPAIGTATDRSTPDSAGNVFGAHRAGDAANTSAAGDRLAAELKRVLAQPKVAAAFWSFMATARELDEGFTADGLRLATLMLTPLPERRRQVLDDLRRMQGRTDLKAAKRRHYVIGILTQQIGATLGLGFDAEGRLRTVPTKPDYAAIGGLADEHGAETLWLTACSIAGLAIEGHPLDYLRATLRYQRERLPRPNGQRPTLAGLGDHAALDYAGAQVLPKEA